MWRVYLSGLEDFLSGQRGDVSYGSPGKYFMWVTYFTFLPLRALFDTASIESFRITYVSALRTLAITSPYKTYGTAYVSVRKALAYVILKLTNNIEF